MRYFSRALNKLQVITHNCDWFIALLAPILIDRSDYFGIAFSTVIGKPLYFSLNEGRLSASNCDSDSFVDDPYGSYIFHPILFFPLVSVAIK